MSRIRLSQEEFERRVEEKNPGKYEILSAYKKQHEKVLVRHKECGYEWNVDPWNLMNGKIKKCPLCNNKWKRDTEDFKKEVRLLYGDEYEVLGELYFHEYADPYEAQNMRERVYANSKRIQARRSLPNVQKTELP